MRAFDLLPRNVAASRALVERVLTAEGWATDDAFRVAQTWVRRADYLLERPAGIPGVDVVVGNPPYIRLEDLPEERMSLYRALWPTMVGRADIYVGFFEAALRSLRAGGRLGFICADRWMRNQYGRELRKLVGDEFALDACIAMHDVDAFEEQVAAYPAVTALRRGVQENARQDAPVPSSVPSTHPFAGPCGDHSDAAGTTDHRLRKPRRGGRDIGGSGRVRPHRMA
ncbi:Eco57I restriction-modification methylase domain-containing protein [Streptosporangium sp. CA-115845]|uniref:Eco57I restriction-modification methylase domain-containing protein n=1 Tax=Streptosporangium sp. CA-115845 TaxID=3240071 RepID=UPI003D916954